MPFEHAVVLGGSVAGLLAAAALSESFGQVTIVDRDDLVVDGPDARASRKGVPHGDQIHHMLQLGSERIDALLPGFDDELVENGCERSDPTANFATYVDGRWLLRVRSDMRITCFQRPMLEWVMRRRVLGRDNVTIQCGLATALLGSPERGRVVGVALENSSKDRLLADLVVDATGRTSNATKWLEALGYDKPEESLQRIFMGYSTFLIEFPTGTLPEGLHGVTCAGTTDTFMGAAIRPCGEGLHIVMAAGMMRNYPPRDVDALISYFETFDSPYLAEFVKAGKAIGDVKTFRLAANHRRYWEKLDRRPEGFVIVGDAVTYFNPTYGQGMTTAALDATVLRETVAAADGEIEGLAAATQSAIAPLVDIAFNGAVRLDSVHEGCEYINLDRPVRQPEVERALSDLQTEDPEVVIAIRRAILRMDHSLIQTESIQSKIANWIESGSTVDPKFTDPLALPEITA
jgi:2-polyprenyl-6-methoxyphenol hydroxylase-like FAD-dependent oxidoreductase